MTARPRTSFDLTRDEMRLLRALAADLGSFVRRGPGAGELGNITDLLRRLTVAYERDPGATAATLRALFSDDAAPTHPAIPSSSSR